ncbi:MAG: glycosyltransferase family 4 protein [Gemmatimonadetes bacterium]|nr:glycosyltransferase family 4 protein [Gemmatimonadota bacterium]
MASVPEPALAWRRGARLALFFTRGVSLGAWAEVGMLERELSIYRRLAEHGVRVRFITYGGEADRSFSDRLGPIGLIPLQPGASGRRHLRQLVTQHWRDLAATDVFKTNQLEGADLALWCKRLFGKKLIVRCGYPYSADVQEQTGDRAVIERALRAERRAFRAAERVVVTSEWARQYSMERHGLPGEKIHVIPNYVVTDVFRPLPGAEKVHDLVCIARASPQKNVEGLLSALEILKARGREVRLLLIGGAGHGGAARERVRAAGLDVKLEGNVASFALPRLLHSARTFVLPSHYEGHPKALLEAMSCGLPCIGAAVRGIREVIMHGETGYLCGTTAEEIADAIARLLDDPELQRRLGSAARKYVLERFALDRVVELEMAVLDEVMAAA